MIEFHCTTSTRPLPASFSCPSLESELTLVDGAHNEPSTGLRGTKEQNIWNLTEATEVQFTTLKPRRGSSNFTSKVHQRHYCTIHVANTSWPCHPWHSAYHTSYFLCPWRSMYFSTSNDITGSKLPRPKPWQLWHAVIIQDSWMSAVNKTLTVGTLLENSIFEIYFWWELFALSVVINSNPLLQSEIASDPMDFFHATWVLPGWSLKFLGHILCLAETFSKRCQASESGKVHHCVKVYFRRWQQGWHRHNSGCWSSGAVFQMINIPVSIEKALSR